jgi:hypothetical protein
VLNQTPSIGHDRFSLSADMSVDMQLRDAIRRESFPTQWARHWMIEIYDTSKERWFVTAVF